MNSNPNKQVFTKFQSARSTVAQRTERSEVMHGRKASTARSAVRPTSYDTTRLLTANGISEITKKMQSPKVSKPAGIVPNRSSAKDEHKLEFYYADTISSRMRLRVASLPRPTQVVSVAQRVRRPSPSKIFDYDLSKKETHYYTHCRKPMKAVPAKELELLKTGERSTYLKSRYERPPDSKYNYPEATSWRYGWFHHQDAAK